MRRMPRGPPTPRCCVRYSRRFWELRTLRLGQDERVLECANNLLDVEPDNLLALVSKSYALLSLSAQDPAYPEESRAALDRAVALDATDPHVALVRIDQARFATAERIRDLRGPW